MIPILIKSRILASLMSIVVAVNAVALYPFLIIRTDLDEHQMNHELIHFEQQRELYIVGFYALYVYDFIKGMIKYKDRTQAYYMIRFEQEAYNNQLDLGYVANRKKQAWNKYEV